MASITVNTNGQTLKVNASISHWTSAALAVVASGDDDIPSTDTTTITSNYTMHFANTATTVTVTVKQLDGTTLFTGTYQVNPGIGPRTLNPVPDPYQLGSDVKDRLALAPSGALAETFSRAGATIANGAVLNSGRLSLVGIVLPAGVPVTTISFSSATTAADTPTAWWFALYSSARALLGQTADQTTTAWAANTVKSVALATPVTTTYSGVHYLGICVVASAVPTLAVTAGLSGINGIAPILCGASNTGLTTTAPATADAISAGANCAYAYVS